MKNISAGLIFGLIFSVVSGTTALLSPPAVAKDMTTQFRNLTVNANFIEAEDKTKPFYLILHGTWAWHGMELPSSLQALLEEESFGSLAFTLSLGQNNRKGFFNCESTITSQHQNAFNEIHHWYKFLTDRGYKNIVLVGHSRGGSQVAGYVTAFPADKISQLITIAPLVWIAANETEKYKKAYGEKLQSLVDLAKSNDTKLMKAVDVLYCKKANIQPQSFLSYYSAQIEKNSPTLISKIGIPLRVYLGSNDPLTTEFLADIKHRKIAGTVEIKVIDGADHYFRDFYIEEVVEDMLEHQL